MDVSLAVPTIRLWHSTDLDGAVSIRAIGFARSHQPDFPDDAYFSTTDDWPEGASRNGWWVVVDVPIAIADLYLDSEPDTALDLRIYRFPFGVINEYRGHFQFIEGQT